MLKKKRLEDDSNFKVRMLYIANYSSTNRVRPCLKQGNTE